MFKFTLQNGKRQLVQGIVLALSAIAFGIAIASITVFLKDEHIRKICNVVLGSVGGLCLLTGIVKMSFGSIVYSSERTSSQSIAEIHKGEQDTTALAKALKQAKKAKRKQKNN